VSEHAKRFERVAFFDDPVLVGARWWHPGAEAEIATDSRRKVMMILGGVIGIPVLCGLATTCDTEPGEADPMAGRTIGALELQRSQGWDVGATGALWGDKAGFVNTDLFGTQGWRARVATLARDLVAVDRHHAWQLPTLLQMPASPANASLARAIQPLRDRQVGQGWWIGGGLVRLLLLAPGAPEDLLIVLDLPGPIAVGAAAAMSRTHVPVWILDGCPHPRGTVPWQRTLGALLFFHQWLTAPQSGPAPAPHRPGVVVLDGNRLKAPSASANEFDNRSLARLPNAAALTSAGYHKVLLVTDGGKDRDDLNPQLAAWASAGIDIRLLSTDNFIGVMRHNGASTPPVELQPDEVDALFAASSEAPFDPTLFAPLGQAASQEREFWSSLAYGSRPAEPVHHGHVHSSAWRFSVRAVSVHTFGQVRYRSWVPWRSSSGSRSGSWGRSSGFGSG